MSTRRHFIEQTTGVVASQLLIGRGLTRLVQPKPLSILILGGTGFIGPHMVRRALDRGHRVTLFNRGKSNTNLFPDVETLLGDRDGKIDALKGRRWDAVIDNSGYVPRHVRDSAQLLEPSVGRYLFISTGSVYAHDQDRYDESSPVLKAPEPASENVEKYYGELKVLCEEAVNSIYGNRGTILRLHIVAGPGDPTHRFTYWPVRIDRGGEVIAPGAPTAPVEFIDARDLAEFTILSLERNHPGTYNVAGPTAGPTSMAEFLYGIRATTRSPVSFTWIDLDFLTERKAQFQLTLSPDKGPMRGLMKVSAAKAVQAGLEFRPLAVTASDTLAWFKTASAEIQGELQLNLERDAKILAEWKARR